MTRSERLARMAGLVATLLPLAPAQAHAHQVAVPPDRVAAVFVKDGVGDGRVVTSWRENSSGHGSSPVHLRRRPADP